VGRRRSDTAPPHTPDPHPRPESTGARRARPTPPHPQPRRRTARPVLTPRPTSAPAPRAVRRHERACDTAASVRRHRLPAPTTAPRRAVSDKTTGVPRPHPTPSHPSHTAAQPDPSSHPAQQVRRPHGLCDGARGRATPRRARDGTDSLRHHGPCGLTFVCGDRAAARRHVRPEIPTITGHMPITRPFTRP
jgi:hypothetical protein